jgi:hypothetical protein
MNPTPRRALAHVSCVVDRATRVAFAAAIAVAAASPAVVRSAPQTCADVLKSIEKRLADAGVQHPPLKIVPKNLASGYRVVGTCEGGTQRIVHDLEPRSSPKDAGGKAGGAGKAGAATRKS